jgi:hypothetical protein
MWDRNHLPPHLLHALILITFGKTHLKKILALVTILQLVTLLSDELRLSQAPSVTTRISTIQPIPKAALSKAWVCGRLLAEIAGFEFRRAHNVCLFLVLCVVR